MNNAIRRAGSRIWRTTQASDAGADMSRDTGGLAGGHAGGHAGGDAGGRCWWRCACQTQWAGVRWGGPPARPILLLEGYLVQLKRELDRLLIGRHGIQCSLIGARSAWEGAFCSRRVERATEPDSTPQLYVARFLASARSAQRSSLYRINLAGFHDTRRLQVRSRTF